MKVSTNPRAGCRLPAEIISHAVWLYFRFALSFRDIEELPAARGIVVTGPSVYPMARGDVRSIRGLSSGVVSRCEVISAVLK